MIGQLVIAPILLPLVVAAVQLLIGARHRRLANQLGLASCLLLVAIAVVLLVGVIGEDSAGRTYVYNLGDWPARFAIVLVADHLSVLMLLLTSVLALVVMPCAWGRWQSMGVHFQPLTQLFLVGLNGAFLTGDLFNLFVFFEVLLAASYGLALHGSGPRRTGASLHYIAINLAASMLFLLGVSLIFGVTGTLNMAMLARKIPTLPEDTRNLLHGGAALLGMAFLVKTAVWPLGFWLPRTYAAATPPVAALFALMTKLGIYVLLRLSLLLFGAGAGPSAHFGSHWLLGAGMLTLVVGTVGMLGARDLGKLAGYAVLISSGTLLGAVGLHNPDVTAGALAYLVVSVLGIASLFLLNGLINPQGETESTDHLEPYDPVGDALYTAEDESRVVRPAPLVALAACFFACALLLSGLPPMSGFLAKFAMLAPMLAIGPAATALFVLILIAGVGTIIALCRAGIQIFWADPDRVFPFVRTRETASVVALLALCLALTGLAAGPMTYLSTTARQAHAPNQYIHAVLPPSAQAKP